MNTPSVAEIFRYGFASYVERFGRQPLDVLKAADAIVSCRTGLLGSHRYQCDHCGNELTLHNSCRNRNCPRCQAKDRIRWVQDRIEDLLPVGYFHAVFTVPEQLGQFAIRNKVAFYRILFRAVKETLFTLANDEKRLGVAAGGIGCTMVLHTWGQTLIEHPHVHVIIPGGGLTPGNTWKACRERFLFPVAVMRKMYRGKLMAFFKEAIDDGSIGFHGELEKYAAPQALHTFINELYAKEWVVFVKPPFASPQAVVKYLGQYTHRIAISDHRIIRFENGMVTFSYKDYADNYRRKEMTLDCIEFIRRFLLHVVPSGFVRIRHYGFLANRNRLTKLTRCMAIFKKKPPQARTGRKRTSWIDAFIKMRGFDPRRCNVCRAGIMQIVELLLPQLPARIVTMT